nr:DUF6114 domain-containing protein [Kitasatospora azatica]
MPTRLWRRFTAWRRTRPFWGGLLAILAGLPILYFPYANLTLGGLTMALATTGGAGALVIGLLLIVLGITAWFQPMSRVFCGVGVTILTLISIPVSNFGGFLAGMILGLIAGGMLCAWVPLSPEDAERAEAMIAAGPPVMNHWAADTEQAPAAEAAVEQSTEPVAEQSTEPAVEQSSPQAPSAEQAGGTK